ncbi:hypothetical protein [Streptomyces natalensis]|uniref:hypothetical protein n=1 Tax=Streptomyces natalensis TaxID=68242 RepID=UPI000A8F7A60
MDAAGRRRLVHPPRRLGRHETPLALTVDRDEGDTLRALTVGRKGTGVEYERT